MPGAILRGSAKQKGWRQMKSNRCKRRRGFSLVELLTVIGIIGILIAILIPALSSARRAARITQCASNLHQLASAMINYATESRGYFPGNVGALNLYWYNRDQIGRYVHAPFEMSNSEQCINSIFVCPSDLDGAVRSYSMNVYASGVVSDYVQAALDGNTFFTNPRGKLWKQGVSTSSRMLLLTESFSYEDWPAENNAISPGTGKTGKWSSPALVGFAGITPGARFISGGLEVPARFGHCASQLCYSRHRAPKEPGTLGDAIGRLNIAFADGHVALHSASDLVDPGTGRSTFLAMWSPIDRQLEMQTP
jgi:prepilin-type N-terminal cleavage/methylation domain-containing protein/prepilin-type processing-associated H-X9-DG protein